MSETKEQGKDMREKIARKLNDLDLIEEGKPPLSDAAFASWLKTSLFQRTYLAKADSILALLSPSPENGCDDRGAQRAESYAPSVEAAMRYALERAADFAATYDNGQITDKDTWAEGFAFAKRMIAKNIRGFAPVYAASYPTPALAGDVEAAAIALYAHDIGGSVEDARQTFAYWRTLEASRAPSHTMNVYLRKAEAVVAVLSRPPETVPEEETNAVWLIEAPARRYLSIMCTGGRDSVSRFFQWTDDPNKAIRFARKIDAEDVLFGLRTDDRDHHNEVLFSFEKHLGDVKAVEHAWVSNVPRASISRSSPAVSETGATRMNDAQIKHMVDRFLGWKLPENFSPDAGISFKPTFNEHTAHPMKHAPVGTNLFDATQAEAMIRYLVEGLAPAETGMARRPPRARA